MKNIVWILLIGTTFALTGCAAKEDVVATSGVGYVENATAVVDAADWSDASRIDVSLSEYEYMPSVLGLQQGKPYHLHLANDGTVTHYFVSDGFFKAIAVARLETPTARIKVPRLKSIAIPPGTTKDLYFVPVVRGEYELECTAPLHALFGMVGKISIE